MNEINESFRSVLDTWGEFVEIILNGLSLLSIIVGVVASMLSTRQYGWGKHSLHTVFRYKFGGWLIVALEFQLAADIVSTIISPTTEHLIELGAIAFIRTFLNFFLSKELIEEKEDLEKAKEKAKE